MSRREPGYRPEPKLYRLTFDEHPGLVVRAKSCSAAQLLRVSELAENTEQGKELGGVRMLFGEFAEVLVSWNLEDQDGEPVPTTLEGLLAQDFDLVIALIDGWMEAVAGVPAPLEQPSSSGAPFLVESLPMEPLSPSRAS